MTITVIIKHKDATEISNLVKDLKTNGLRINVDFDFEYTPGKWDDFKGTIPRQTKFIFYDQDYGLMFALQHGNED